MRREAYVGPWLPEPVVEEPRPPERDPLGRGWIGHLPPYEERLIRDAGGLDLAFAILLACAASRCGALPLPAIVLAGRIRVPISA